MLLYVILVTRGKILVQYDYFPINIHATTRYIGIVCIKSIFNSTRRKQRGNKLVQAIRKWNEIGSIVKRTKSFRHDN